MPFDFPKLPHVRRHHPAGYLDYRTFKEWLRDEFCFRCAYCLFRERWYPVGADAFSVEHVVPQSVDPKLVTEYDNLIYACIRCNSRRRAATGLPDPCQVGLGTLLYLAERGHLRSAHDLGEDLIDVLDLNDPEIIEWRERMLVDYAEWRQAGFPADDRRGTWFHFPRKLPDLSLLKPPEGNTRPEGLRQTWYAKRVRGELPRSY